MCWNTAVWSWCNKRLIARGDTAAAIHKNKCEGPLLPSFSGIFQYRPTFGRIKCKQSLLYFPSLPKCRDGWSHCLKLRKSPGTGLVWTALLFTTVAMVVGIRFGWLIRGFTLKEYRNESLLKSKWRTNWVTFVITKGKKNGWCSFWVSRSLKQMCLIRPKSNESTFLHIHSLLLYFRLLMVVNN